MLLLLPSTTYRAAAFVEAARRLGIELTVASDHASVFGASQPEHLLALPFRDPARTRARVREFAAAHPVRAVFGVDDDTAVLAAECAEELGLQHNSVASCRAARDKHLQRRLLAAAGVPAPAFALHRLEEDPSAVAAAVRFPCVVKPTGLSMSRGVMRADDAAQFVASVGRLRAILAQPDAAAACGDAAGVYLVEDYVPGREVAVEGLLDADELHVLTVFDKPDPLEGPFFEETIYATPTSLGDRDRQAVRDCVRDAARALGLSRGPVHAEVRLNERGAWLIELAARPIGGRCSSVLRFGDAALEDVLLSHALGLPWRPSAAPAPAAVMMIPTPRAGTLAGVGGVDDARRVPWIDDVVITAHAGEQLVPLPEGNRYLGFIFARAGDTGTAVAAVRAAHSRLSLELG